MLATLKCASLAAVACALAVPASAAASDYNTGVLADGPTLYWQLDEASGMTADNAATADGAGDGLVTGASVLGSDGAFSMSPHAATLQGASAITTAVQGPALAVEFWVKPASAGSGAFLTYGNGFELGYNARRKLTLSVAGGPAKDTRVGLPLNRWTLVDVSLNAGIDGDDAQVFTNGGTWRVKTVKNAGVVPNLPAATVTLDGAIGGIDELAAFPTALTQAQAFAHYVVTGLPRSATPPTVSGTLQVGQTLTATPGTWSNATSTGLQWRRCDSADPTTNTCDDITGATGTTYLPQDADLGSYVSVSDSATNLNGVGAVDSVAVGPITAAQVVDPGPGPGPGTTITDPGTGAPITDPGTVITAPDTTAVAPVGTTPTTTVVPGCVIRLARVAPKKVKIKGAGRLTVKAAKRRGGKVTVAIKAAKATKKRLAKVAFKLDRKTLKRNGKRLRRSFRLANLQPGKHALKLKVRPRHGKTRTIKITLRVTCR